MIKCPSCNHDNVDGTTFCEMCGEELAGAGSTADNAASAVAGTPAAAASNDVKCPACENLNPPENVACEVCGTDLRGNPGDAEEEDVPPAITPGAAATPPAADAAPATGDASADAAPDTTSLIVAEDGDAVIGGTSADTAVAASLAPGQLKLTVEQGMTVGKQFVLGDTEMLVGREDEDEEIFPDIDLGDQDEGYVHRKHATLKFENGQLFVTHLGGANRTRLNNKPIPDNEPQAVKLGDKIAFGKVVLRVQPA